MEKDKSNNSWREERYDELGEHNSPFHLIYIYILNIWFYNVCFIFTKKNIKLESKVKNMLHWNQPTVLLKIKPSMQPGLAMKSSSSLPYLIHRQHFYKLRAWCRCAAHHFQLSVYFSLVLQSSLVHCCLATLLLLSASHQPKTMSILELNINNKNPWCKQYVQVCAINYRYLVQVKEWSYTLLCGFFAAVNSFLVIQV